MIESSSLSDRLSYISQTLPPSVKLIAVTKQVSLELMQLAYSLGIRDFGENRVQDAWSKYQALGKLDGLTWHLIGHLQTNKARLAIEMFDWIHSVDSLKLALKLDELAIAHSRHPHICLQVKLLPDPDKFGFSVSELLESLPILTKCQNIQIEGLMTILPLGLTESESLAAFGELKNLANQINHLQYHKINITQLSMGMSDDYHLAVQAGATMIRLGRSLFSDSPLSNPVVKNPIKFNT